MNYLLAFVVSLVYIGLKATQQRQVMAAQYLRMPGVSIAMGFCEVFIVANVARTAESTWGLALLAFSIGAGGGFGSMIGTYLHKRTYG